MKKSMSLFGGYSDCTRRREKERRQELLYPRRFSAKKKVRYAIKVGRLAPPGLCMVRGCFEQGQYHHDNYDFPLQVRPLCWGHHAAWHVINGPAPGRSCRGETMMPVDRQMDLFTDRQ